MTDIGKEGPELLRRMEIHTQDQAFVTMKDHKEDFKEHKALECRLIKPSKSDLGKISKRRLEIINQIVRDKLKSNQWKSKNPENKQTWRKPSFHSLRKLANFC